MTSPLDRPIWHALADRQSEFAIGNDGVRRFRSDVSPFIACADDSPETLARVTSVMGAHDAVLFLQRGRVPLPPGTRLVEGARGVQMVAERFAAIDPPAGVAALGEEDAPAMLALATRTQPGPFRARTHELAQYWGVKDEDGRLLAMAGERLRLPGMSEVSGVCTHPDTRGRGLGGTLSAHIASEIVRRGEVPFLHVYSNNARAIRLYENLGFVARCEVESVMVRRV